MYNIYKSIKVFILFAFIIVLFYIFLNTYKLYVKPTFVTLFVVLHFMVLNYKLYKRLTIEENLNKQLYMDRLTITIIIIKPL